MKEKTVGTRNRDHRFDGFQPGIAGSSLAQTPYKDLKYPKLNDIRLPQVEQVTLSNGMRLFYPGGP